jgi:hypothetical protein
MFIYVTKNAPLRYLNTMLYHSYMFRHPLRHPQGAINRDFNLLKLLLYHMNYLCHLVLHSSKF